jgi:hypothetical protein
MAVQQQELTISTKAPKGRPSSFWHLDARTIERGKQGVRSAREVLREAQARRAAATHADRSAA